MFFLQLIKNHVIQLTQICQEQIYNPKRKIIVIIILAKMFWDLNQVKDMCISFHYSHLRLLDSIYGSYYELLTTMCVQFLQKTNWVLCMAKWSFWTPIFLSPFEIYHMFISTNHFIIGTIHKHQNFKKLTQQATTKQSLAKNHTKP